MLLPCFERNLQLILTRGRNGQDGSSRWRGPSPGSRDQDVRGRGGEDRGHGGRGQQPEDWTRPLARNQRLEAELFSGGSSGINFGRYEDIPVEATGTHVPAPIQSFEEVELTPVIKAEPRSIL